MFAEAGGGAEVNGEDGIAAVGEPLVQRVEPPDISPGRAAMNDKHHGKWFFCVAGNSEITDQVQAVARSNDHGTHRRQRQSLKRIVIVEKEPRFATFSIINV